MSDLPERKRPTARSLIFSALLGEARKDQGLTQKAVAHACGTTQPIVAAWEAGTKFPARRFLLPLSKILAVDVVAILEAIERGKAA